MNELNEMLDAYSKLSLDAKRNEFNSEMLFLSATLDFYLEQFGLVKENTPFNYDSHIHSELQETELLEKNYQDLVYLKRKILFLINNLTNNE